jgi:hypothetical protein
MSCSATGTLNDVSPQTAELQAQLRARLLGRVSDLHLQFHDEGIVLRGRSRTFYAKQLAQHEVMRETCMPILANEIEVV